MSKRELTSLGKWLRDFRKTNHVSATQMAAALSMSESRLFKIETGELAVPRNFYFAFLQTGNNWSKCRRSKTLAAKFTKNNQHCPVDQKQLSPGQRLFFAPFHTY